MKLTGKHVILSLVLLVLGFLISFSYQQTKNDAEIIQLSDQEWEKDYYYREQLISLEEKNKELRQELLLKRKEIQQIEAQLGLQEVEMGDQVEKKRELQMLTGELPIKGKGIEITLRDANYIPSEANANQYMVHERHIHLVVNELLSSGAKAVAINGQRLFKDSYIACIGPVISVDGVQYPAPFTISAIGNSDYLETSLTITNGIVDMLVSDNIEVTLGKSDTIEMKARGN